jgi:hypothetical protein
MWRMWSSAGGFREEGQPALGVRPAQKCAAGLGVPAIVRTARMGIEACDKVREGFDVSHAKGQAVWVFA